MMYYWLLNLTLKGNKHLGTYYFKREVLQEIIHHNRAYQPLFISYISMALLSNLQFIGPCSH